MLEYYEGVDFMRIKALTVEGLFNRFTHHISFAKDERIAIMLGPNGFGKTMILQIVNGIFNHSPWTLTQFPFSTFEVLFDDEEILRVRRLSDDASSPTKVELQLHSSFGESEPFYPQRLEIDPDELNFPVRMIEEIVPELTQVGPQAWRNVHTGRRMSLSDVVSEFAEYLPQARSERLASDMPEWYRRLRESVPVRFVDTERLNYSPRIADDIPFRSINQRRRSVHRKTISRYSMDLAARIDQTLKEYGRLSQQLDQSFPVRALVEKPAVPTAERGELKERLAAMATKRSRLIEAGLLAEEQNGFSTVPLFTQLESVQDDARLEVLAVYAQDTEEKLGVFDSVYEKIDTFKRIANSRLAYKRVVVGVDGFSVVSDEGSALDLEALSSGEQHELVMLYDLLFLVEPNSLILVDEPELSLHVDWQRSFLDDLLEMASLSGYYALLATHSPQIIGDRWDLTVSLKGPASKARC